MTTTTGFSRRIQFLPGERFRWEWSKMFKRDVFGVDTGAWQRFATATDIPIERLRRIHRHHGGAPVGTMSGNATAAEATAICTALDLPAYTLKTRLPEPDVLPSGQLYVLARRVMANEEEGEELLNVLREAAPQLLAKYLPEALDDDPPPEAGAR